MASIRLLDPLVRSRIAAGEVVENPASVVKELVENSLDARATRIDIEIVDGGRAKIRVTDDGAGMYPDDVPLSVDHYATSKIQTAEDIFEISTYGFRGEALAAIAAVSRFTLTTRRRELNEGTLLRILENSKKRAQPMGAPPGTTVLVEDLFYSFPARRKFLKSTQAETAKVAETVLRTALFRPEVSFTLHSEKRVMLDLPGCEQWIERVADCLGNDVANELVPIDISEGTTVKIRGFLGRPSLHRNNRTAIFTAVDDRPIFSTELLNAVNVGYRGLLPERRYPVAVLSVKVPPRYVDINVHPQKKEARFREIDIVTRVIRREIALALVGTGVSQVAAISEEPVEQMKAATVSKEAPPVTPGNTAVETKPVVSQKSAVKQTAEKPTKERFDLWHGAMKMPIPGGGGSQDAVKTGAPSRKTEELEKHAVLGEKPVQTKETPGERVVPSEFLYIGQTTEGYMVVEGAGKLRIVDPHALHERMIYEKLKRREGHGELLRMLFPVVVSLSARERAYKDLLVQVMREVGFEVDDFGPNDIAVSAVPTVFEGGDPGGVARDVLDALTAGGDSAGKDTASELREKAFASAACHAAVKLGKRFREEEAVAFLKDASLVAAVQVCPHGRPTSVDIDLNSIKGRLSR